MSMWLRSERDTAELRKAVDCSPDACVFRKADLMAVVQCDRLGTWQILLAAGGRIRDIEEVLEAREVLLPGIEDFAVMPGPKDIGIPVIVIVEIREGANLTERTVQ